jgi:hypothetical protein
MNRYYFGKDQTVTFTYPEGATPYGTPTIYLFDSLPGREAAQDGTGALQTISAWTSHATLADTKEFTLGAITDPEIDSTDSGDDYYLAINYRLENAGQIQTEVKHIWITRVGGSLSHHGVTVEEITAAYPTLASYLQEYEIEDQLTLAIEEVKAELSRQGVNWDKVIKKDELYFPLLCKAIANACLSEFEEEGDRYYKRYEIFEKKYNDFMGQYTVKSDEDGSGDTDKTATLNQDYILNYR